MKRSEWCKEEGKEGAKQLLEELCGVEATSYPFSLILFISGKSLGLAYTQQEGIRFYLLTRMSRNVWHFTPLQGAIVITKNMKYWPVMIVLRNLHVSKTMNKCRQIHNLEFLSQCEGEESECFLMTLVECLISANYRSTWLRITFENCF